MLPSWNRKTHLRQFHIRSNINPPAGRPLVHHVCGRVANWQDCHYRSCFGLESMQSCIVRLSQVITTAGQVLKSIIKTWKGWHHCLDWHDPRRRGHRWRSIGKSSRFIRQVALEVKNNVFITIVEGQLKDGVLKGGFESSQKLWIGSAIREKAK